MMPVADGPLAAKRVLVVEDEFLVGLTLCEDLAALAAQVTGPVASLGEALQLVQQQQFDAALIDVNLRGEMSFPLADELVARNVPFMFVTGYGDDTIPQRFRQVLRIAKPHDPKILPSLVRRMAQQQ
jgi:CheY-like chemotaxis protein